MKSRIRETPRGFQPHKKGKTLCIDALSKAFSNNNKKKTRKSSLLTPPKGALQAKKKLHGEGTIPSIEINLSLKINQDFMSAKGTLKNKI